MQAAGHRRQALSGARSADKARSSLALAPTADDALLDALPIAAAIVSLTSKGILKLVKRNPRFDEVMASTGDAAMMSGDFRQCSQIQIARMMIAFLADFTAPNELDFCVGDEVSARAHSESRAVRGADP